MKKEITRKVVDAAGIKSIDSEKRIIKAYASTNQWDRYGERFEADAFKGGLDNYKKNPVVMFAHDYKSLPIAKTVDYEFDLKGLILDMQFADHPMARDVFALYEGGFMNAFSVGFTPLEVGFEERTAGSGDMGAVFKKAELLENSAVPIPANPGALVKSGLMGAACRVFQTKEPELSEGAAPDLRTSLEYLIGLGKILKHKGKVQDEDIRSLLMQTNNICRELIYGAASPRLEAGEGPMSDEEVAAMVREYEVLSEMVAIKGGSVEEQKELIRLGAVIEKLISGN